MANKTVQMPQWSSGDMRGKFKLDLATTTHRLKLTGLLFCDDEKQDLSMKNRLRGHTDS